MTLAPATRLSVIRRYARGDLLKHIAHDFSITQSAVSKMVNRLGLRRLPKVPHMPTPASSAPLERVSMNLYSSDVAAMKAKLGFGWTATVRELVKLYVKGEIKL